MRLRLVICRHTQTDDNAQGKYTGQNDVLLNNEGARQAEALADKLATLPRVQAVITSDLARARAVAEIIVRRLGVPAFEHRALREIDVGRMAGMLKVDAKALFPNEHHRTSFTRFDFTDIGGESWNQAVDRINRLLQRLTPRCGSTEHDIELLPRVVLVGHGSAFRRVFVDEHRVIDHLHEQGDYQEFVWPPSPVSFR